VPDASLEPITLKITDLARAGAGVAREESGRVVFVPYTAPGDVVRARIVGYDKRYAQAELVEILESSVVRVTPPCPAFTRCGGCSWQHIPYELQWQTKVRGVRQALSRVKLTCVVEIEELPAQQIWNYRNRVQLRGEGRNLGFYAAGSHTVVPLDRCEIARSEINQVWAATRDEGIQKSPIQPYKVEVEILDSGEIRKTWNSRHAASGFRQVHDEQNARLQSWVADALLNQKVGLTLPKGEPHLLHLLDLFGGAGNLSLPLAAHFGEIHCVDVTAPIGASGATNLKFHRSAVVPWLRKFKGEGRSFSAILDPPREGLAQEFDEIATTLERLKVTDLVAVGCDADSWVRDLSRFVRRGWTLERIAMVDLFPQTPHVESIALLRNAP